VTEKKEKNISLSTSCLHTIPHENKKKEKAIDQAAMKRSEVQSDKTMDACVLRKECCRK